MVAAGLPAIMILFGSVGGGYWASEKYLAREEMDDGRPEKMTRIGVMGIVVAGVFWLWAGGGPGENGAARPSSGSIIVHATSKLGCSSDVHGSAGGAWAGRCEHVAPEICEMRFCSSERAAGARPRGCLRSAHDTRASPHHAANHGIAH